MERHLIARARLRPRRSAPPMRPAEHEMDHTRTPYLSALRAHLDTQPVRLNTPGHHGGSSGPTLENLTGADLRAADIPGLIEGVDRGPSPTPYEEAERLAADAWGAKRSWFVLGGASNAIRTGLIAVRSTTGRILVQRNCHGSVIDGLVLAGFEVLFIDPELDDELGIAHCLTPERVRSALQADSAIGAVLVISPTYFGAVPDLRGISAACREHDAALLVDEAWGSHLAFGRRYPTDALSAGADLVVSSAHKTGGSLEQTALLHLGQSRTVRPDEVERAFRLLDSTSPSALLAASLDAARAWLATRGPEALELTLAARDGVDTRLRGIAGVEVLGQERVGAFGIAELDPLHLCLDVRGTGRSGAWVKEKLERRGVFVELGEGAVVMAVIGAGEDHQAIEPLAAALQQLHAAPAAQPSPVGARPPRNPGEIVVPRAAFFSAHERVPLEQSKGRVSAETLSVYPPGIPGVVVGEPFDQDSLEVLSTALERGALVRGASDPSLRSVLVVR
jgi:arginine decarboxylase